MVKLLGMRRNLRFLILKVALKIITNEQREFVIYWSSYEKEKMSMGNSKSDRINFKGRDNYNNSTPLNLQKIKT